MLNFLTRNIANILITNILIGNITKKYICSVFVFVVIFAKSFINHKKATKMKTIINFGLAMICTAAAVACGQSQTQPQSLGERVDGFFSENPNEFSGAIEIQ